MKPRIKVITLGVDDLDQSLHFYRDGLELPTQGVVGTEFEDGAVVFFEMNDDLVLALYPRSSLAKDANTALGDASPSDFSIGHNVASKDEVDEIIGSALRAGAKLADAPRERFWGGYSGYFTDPDGHLWEIAWNPDWDGSLDASREEESIRALEQAYDEAWNSGPVTSLITLFAEDAVLINPRGRSARGLREIEQVLTDVLSGAAKGSKHTSEVSRIGFITDEVAIVDGEATLQGMRDKTGAPSDIFHSFTDIVVKRRGQWMLAHVRGYFLDRAGTQISGG